MKQLIKYIYLLLLLVTTSCASISLDAKHQYIDIIDVKYYEDVTNSLSLQEIQKQTFLQDRGVASFGFTDSAYWIKISINPTTKSMSYKWWLNIKYPLLYEIDLYTCDKNDKLLSLKKSGKMRPFESRKIKDRNFLFEIDTNIDQILYLRILTQSSMQIPMSIQTSESLIVDSQYSMLFTGIYYGVFALIFFYNFISLMFTRNKKYFLYLIFISSFATYQLSLDGVGVLFLWSKWTWMIDKGVGVTMGIMVFAIIMFSREFLDTKTRTPFVDKFLIFLGLIIFIVTLLAPFVEYKDVIQIIAVSSFILPVVLLGTSIKIYKIDDFYPARFYILGWGSFLIGSTLFAMNKFAWIEGYDFLSYAQQVGSALEMFFLSWALADLQKQSEREYIDKLSKLNEHLQNKVSENIIQIRENDKKLIEKSRLAAMGEMIEQIAHQWRQPLHTLALLNQNLYFKVQLETAVKEDLKNTHDKINDQLQYMSQTIEDFRSFSNPDKTREVFSMEEVIRSALNLSDGSLKMAKIKAHLFSDKKTLVFGMRHEIMQVFMNLIKNTHDSVLSKKIKEPFIKIFVETKDNHVYINFEDNAGGINEDEIDNIFEAYFSTKEKENGTGIGLYMSKEIVEGMSGEISAKNSEHGVVFTIVFPEYKEKL